MPATHDIYGPIHKGLRFGSAQLLIRLGCADWRDEQATRALLSDLRLHLELSHEHLEHEDREYMPGFRTPNEKIAAQLEADHEDHHRTFGELKAGIAAVEAASPRDRTEPARALYLRFSLYFANDMLHMAREETDALPLFHAQFSNSELQAMEGRIIASIPPDRLVQYYHIMLPGMNPQERAAFLRYVGGTAPPEALVHLRDVVAKEALPPHAYRVLMEDLSVAA
jgi:hypothetical protein